MVRLSERIYVHGEYRGTVRWRRMRCECGQCPVAPIPRIKHNTKTGWYSTENVPVHVVVSRVSEQNFGDSVICSGIFYRYQPMESVTRAVTQYGGPSVHPDPGVPTPRHRHRCEHCASVRSWKYIVSLRASSRQPRRHSIRFLSRRAGTPRFRRQRDFQNFSTLVIIDYCYYIPIIHTIIIIILWRTTT